MLIVPRAFMYYTAQLILWITFCNLLRATIDYNSAPNILDNTLQCVPHIALYNSAPWSVPWACSMGRGASHPLFSFATLKFVLTTYRWWRCPGSEGFGSFISKLYELAFNHKIKQKPVFAFVNCIFKSFWRESMRWVKKGFSKTQRYACEKEPLLYMARLSHLHVKDAVQSKNH